MARHDHLALDGRLTKTPPWENAFSESQRAKRPADNQTSRPAPAHQAFAEIIKTVPRHIRP